MWQTWLVVSGIFFVLEIFTVGFLVFWFAIGALITMIFSFFITNVITQVSIFLITSTLLLFATKPFVSKITKRDQLIKTNAFSVEGKIGKVIADINPIEGKGQIIINGETWSAKSYNDTYISKDSEVIVEKIDGVKVIVKPLKEKIKNNI